MVALRCRPGFVTIVAGSLALVLAAGEAMLPSSHAAIDLTGKWGVRADGLSGFRTSIGCQVEIAQHGTGLSLSGSCELAGAVNLTGTFDPNTLMFKAIGSSAAFCSSLAIDGAAASDGQSFAGTFHCDGPFPMTGTFRGSHCGNGILDPGEQCDDGNLFEGDCCSATCQFEERGSRCPDDSNSCTDDLCDGRGVCAHIHNTASCDDGNDCTVGDMCAAGQCVPGQPAPSGTPCGERILPGAVLSATATAPLDLCAPGMCNASGTCIPLSASDRPSCDDGDPCTIDACTSAGCLHESLPGLSGARCRFGALLAQLPAIQMIFRDAPPQAVGGNTRKRRLERLVVAIEHIARKLIVEPRSRCLRVPGRDSCAHATQKRLRTLSRRLAKLCAKVRVLVTIVADGARDGTIDATLAHQVLDGLTPSATACQPMVLG
jgi:cysteine-rich repeat protein